MQNNNIPHFGFIKNLIILTVSFQSSYSEAILDRTPGLSKSSVLRYCFSLTCKPFFTDNRRLIAFLTSLPFFRKEGKSVSDERFPHW